MEGVLDGLDDVNAVAAVTAHLKLTERKVMELARTGRIAAIKEGRAWLFPREGVREHVQRNTRPARGLSSLSGRSRQLPRRGRTFP